MEALLGAHAAHRVKVAVSFVVFYTTSVFTGLIAEFAASSRPVVFVAAVREEEFLYKVGGQVGAGLPGVIVFAISFPPHLKFSIRRARVASDF